MKKAIIGAAAFVLAVWLCTFFFVPRYYPTLDAAGNPTTRPVTSPGVFGDMFGAANSLLTGLSTVLVVVALILQANQMKHQQEEQDRLRELLTETVELQSGQVDGLVTLAMLLKQDGQRKGLEFLVERKQAEIDQLERIRAGLPSSFAKGSADDKYRQKILTKLDAARKEHKKYSDELKTLKDDAHAEG